MKTILSKIAGIFLAAGVIFLIVGVMDVYEKWSVDTTPSDIVLDALNGLPKEPRYVKLKGGRLDILNAYEESLTYKNSDAKLNSHYFIPVLNSEEKVAYILKTGLAPNLDDALAQDSEYTGLLEGSESLSEEMLAAFKKKLQFSGSVRVLDASFKAKSRWDRILDLKLAIYLLGIGIVLQILAGKVGAAKNKNQEGVE